MEDYLGTLDQKRSAQAEAKFKQDTLTSFNTLSSEIRTLLTSLDKTGVKKLDKEYIKAVKDLEKVLKALSDIRVRDDDNIRDALTTLAYVLANLDVKPVVNVPAPKVEVNERQIDFKPVIEAIRKIQTKAPEVKVDTDAMVAAVRKVDKTLKDLRFPASNFILPFKNSQGAAAQVQLDSSGNVPIAGEITVDTGDLATSANQTDGSQKTQIVDPGGEAVTVTDGKLDVNASIDTTGLATSANQTTELAHLAAIETAVELLDNTVSGSELQVDVVGALPAGDNNIGNVDIASIPTVTVQATDLDIRNLTATDVVTANLSATDNAVLDSIDTSTASKYITGIGHGVKTVTSAGTDEALASSTACKRVTIQAQTDNTGLIAVGGSGVDATEATGTGVILYAGDVFELDIDNLADVYIDATVNGEGVRYAYFS